MPGQRGRSTECLLPRDCCPGNASHRCCWYALKRWPLISSPIISSRSFRRIHFVAKSFRRRSFRRRSVRRRSVRRRSIRRRSFRRIHFVANQQIRNLIVAESSDFSDCISKPLEILFENVLDLLFVLSNLSERDFSVLLVLQR